MRLSKQLNMPPEKKVPDRRVEKSNYHHILQKGRQERSHKSSSKFPLPHLQTVHEDDKVQNKQHSG